MTGAGIVVDGRRLPAPYTISVIGPPATMRTALMIPGGVADAVARDGGNVIVTSRTVRGRRRAAPRRELEYASPYGELTDLESKKAVR